MTWEGDLPNAKRVGEVIESLPPRQKVHGRNKIRCELVELASESSDEATSSFYSWIVVAKLERNSRLHFRTLSPMRRRRAAAEAHLA